MTDTDVVLLETINPNDLKPEDLQELADQLQELLPDHKFEVAYEEQFGSGVTWFEVLRLWLPDAMDLKDHAYELLLDACIAYMSHRFTKRHYERRPKMITIHDSSGREIATVKLADETSDPEQENSNLSATPRKRPKGRHRV